MYKRQEREFIYHDKLYDVINIEDLGNSFRFKCLEDVKEKHLINSFSKYISNFFGFDNSGIASKVKLLLSKLQFDFYLTINNFKIFRILTYLDFNIIKFNKISSYLEIESPPPELFFHN